MSEMPVPWQGGHSHRQVQKAARAREHVETEIYGHALQRRFAVECEAIDREALTEVVKGALASELETYDWAMSQVDGSTGKAELVADKINILRHGNSARIARQFGGA